jgi:TRAP-type C4-dicarboxylate transport system permease small subunit
MKSFVNTFTAVGTWMNAVAGTIVYFMMFLTVADVVLRFFGKPILGSYELMSLLGATVFGFAIPKTSLERGNVCVDILTEKSSEAVQRVLFIVTRIPSIALFGVLTCFLFRKGFSLYKVHETTSILQIPRYLLVCILAFCCLIQFFVLIVDISKTVDGKGEGR